MKGLFLFLIISALLLSGCSSTKKLAGTTQDGTSYQTAIIIREKQERTGIDAEYAWIRSKYPNSSTRGQALTYHNKKPFDIIKITTAAGKELDVYFDVSNFYGKF
jgi:uncharacterized protein YceK